MQLRGKRVFTLLSLLPLFYSAIATPLDTDDVKNAGKSVKEAAVKALPKLADKAGLATSSPLVVAVPTKATVGTKDAPVDGLDGKPHAGPFVDASSGAEKAKPVKESTVTRPKVKTSDNEDGVMNDANRAPPRKGTTGTEGGVSEKERLSEAGGAKRPEAPKAVPVLPAGDSARLGLHTAEQLKQAIHGDDSVSTVDKPRGAAGIEKPIDLPDKTHDTSRSDTIVRMKDSVNDKSKSLVSTAKTASSNLGKMVVDEEGKHDLIPWDSLMGSFSSIVATEIGDKTFIVAALMAMRYPRLQVFTAAASALLIMTILSAVAGHALGAIISKRWSAVVAALLFLGFGAKSIQEGMAMDSNAGVGEEMREVEAELEEKEIDIARAGGQRSAYSLEAGRKGRDSPSPSGSPSRRSLTSPGGIKNLLSLLLSPAWVETFSMTFIGELGDRSQIATVAMAAGQEYYWVMVGACVGHVLCTGFAVLGGSLMAGRISMKKVTLAGGGIFILFGIFTAYEAVQYFA